MQLNELTTSQRLRLMRELDARWNRLLTEHANESILCVTVSARSLESIASGGKGHLAATMGDFAKEGCPFDFDAHDREMLDRLNHKKRNR